MRVRKIAEERQLQLRRARLSVRVEELGSHWTDFHEIWHLVIFFFSKISQYKLRFQLYLTGITGTLPEDIRTYMKMSR